MKIFYDYSNSLAPREFADGWKNGMQGYEDKSPEMQTLLSSLQKYSSSGTDNMGKGGGQTNNDFKSRAESFDQLRSDLMPQAPKT